MLQEMLLHLLTSYKKQVIHIILLCFMLPVYAQVGLRVAPGVLVWNESDNFGLLCNLEPKIEISNNTVLGMRFGIALNTQKFEINDSSQFSINNEQNNAVFSLMPTFDYYFNQDKMRPYIGTGLGYYLFNTTDVFQFNAAGVMEGSAKNQLGILLRSGIESGRTRLGLEYNFIPKADIEIPDGRIIGAVNNSYLGVTIGFTIGNREG